MAEEQLIIEVKYEDHDAKAKVDALTKSFERLNAVTSGNGFTKLNNVARSLASLGQSLSGISGAGASLREVARSANALSTAFKSFDGRSIRGLDRVANALNSINIQNKSLDAVSKLANGLGRLTSAAKDPNLSQNLQTLARNIATFAQNVANNISDETLSRFERLGAAMAGLSSGSGKSFNVGGMAGSAGYASKLFGDLGNNIMRVVKLGWQLSKLPFKMILSPIQKAGQGLIGMTNRFTTFLKGIGRIALYRAIRTGIKLVTSAVREGVNNLYIWAGMVGNSFKPTMDSLATSFLYLKNSIGAMVSPLLDALAPALETVVNQIVDVLNIFNQVIATMTGATTWRKALRAPASYADSISGLGHDAEDASDAVKELKRTILGFDEINRLEDKTKTLSPKQNGKDPTGYYAKQGAFSFVEEPISQTALNIADKLKEAWAKGDFTDIGNAIGKKIGDALLRVQWEKDIQPAVKKLATSVGTLLNGLLDYNGEGGKAMWDGIAYTIYNAINTAVLGYTTFFDTVHWEGIGEGIGSAVHDVCKNINWTKGKNSLADALAAFPNAVIDTLTGFTKQFTTQDFFELGQNIGNTVSKAITEIKWADLFKNTFKIATGIVAAFNGALTGFDWSSVKGAILGGIKKIPSKTWSDLGVEIGQAIFNITVFVANLVDTLVQFVKAGNWGALFDGIKTGITNGLKQYGGWTGVAKKLGEWIPENIGTISIILALAVGLLLLKALPAAFATTVMNALNLKKVPGTGMTLGAWVKGLSIAAGVVMAVDTIKTILGTNFNSGDLKTKIGNTLGIALRGAIAGGLFGFGVGNFLGGVYGMIIGAGISLSFATLKASYDKLGTSGFLATLGGGIAGAIAGFTFLGTTLGGPLGAVIGFSVGAVITFLVQSVDWDMSKVGGSGSQFDFGDANGTGNSTFLGSAGYQKDKNGNIVKIETQDRRYGAGNIAGQKWNEVSVTLKPTVKQIDVEAAWRQLTQWWTEITKTNTVTQFSTKGLNNQSKSWLSQLTGWWNLIVGGNNVKEFTTNGLNNQSGSWWSQLTGWWDAIVGLNKAKEFQTTGVKNQSGSWWRQLTGWWNEIVNNNKAKDFRVDVKDDSSSWWRSVKKWWSEVTSGNSLKSTVSIDNAYNAFVSAWNTMQRSFNNNPLTAYVKTVQTGTQVGGSVKGALTNPSGTVVNTKTGKSVVGSNGAWNIDITSFLTGGKKKKKASGGIYKNGQWHDVTAFAAGGSPMSGQMFIAREAGPELVGSIGGNTAVLNNDQIVASVSAGVAQAVASVLGGGNTNEITINVDSETLYRAVRKGERMASGRYGTSIAIG